MERNWFFTERWRKIPNRREKKLCVELVVNADGYDRSYLVDSYYPTAIFFLLQKSYEIVCMENEIL